MKEIVKILVRRDGISENEAWNLVEACREELLDAIEHGASLLYVEDIVADWLGLEPDYLEMLL